MAARDYATAWMMKGYECCRDSLGAELRNRRGPVLAATWPGLMRTEGMPSSSAPNQRGG